MSSIRLSRIHKQSGYHLALIRDYTCGDAPAIFSGNGLHGETVTAFVREDGSAFVAIDEDPEGYIKFSAALHDPNATVHHTGVDEYEFDKGTFKYSAKRITINAESTIF
jgi:hypothetical protein